MPQCANPRTFAAGAVALLSVNRHNLTFSSASCEARAPLPTYNLPLLHGEYLYLLAKQRSVSVQAKPAEARRRPTAATRPSACRVTAAHWGGLSVVAVLALIDGTRQIAERAAAERGAHNLGGWHVHGGTGTLACANGESEAALRDAGNSADSIALSRSLSGSPPPCPIAPIALAC
jgi:hypothetical protein